LNRAQRLLREPPEAFRVAVGGLHQDSHHGFDAGATLAELVATSTYRVDQRVLFAYVDSLLTEPMIDDTDLRALLNRHCTAWGVRTKDARPIFEEVRAALRSELKIDD
jgi:hypothetical protein